MPTMKLSQVALKYQNDPVLFFKEQLGFDPWEKQVEIVECVRDHRRVAVCSANKCGKSAACAAIALWWVSTHAPAEVVLTAPTYRQIGVIWKEIKTFFTRNQLKKLSEFKIKGKCSENPMPGLKINGGNQIIGFAAENKEAFQGRSSENMLIIVDEASGIEAEIFEGINGMLAPEGSKLLMIGNPTRNSGDFFDAFHTKINLYKTMQISALDTPNFAISKRTRRIKGLADAEWEAEQKELNGFPSAWYDVHVLGKFTEQETNTVIPYFLIEKALNNREKKTPSNEDQLYIGVDVGRHSDPSIVTAIRGGWAYSPWSMKKTNLVDQADKILEYATSLMHKNQIPIVVVDVGGIGQGLVDILRKNNKVKTVPINFASKARKELRYPNKRSEMWFETLEWLKREDCSLPSNQQKLISELTCPNYKYDSKDRRVVQSKDEIKDLIGRSCDYADSLNLAVYMQSKPIADPDIMDLLPTSNVVEKTEEFFDELSASRGADFKGPDTSQNASFIKLFPPRRYYKI